MKKKIRTIAAALSLIFVVGLLPMTALAVEEQDPVETETVYVENQEPAETVDIEENDAAVDSEETTDIVDAMYMADTQEAPTACTVTVNVKYVEFTAHDSGGSHYNNASVTDGEPQVFDCTIGEANTLELVLPEDGYVMEASFLDGNTGTSVVRGMDGSVSLVTTPTKDAKITVKVGQQWTSRVYVYNMVLVNGTYGYQFPGFTSATVLMPKGQDAAASFAASDARDTAYLDTNLQPAISGDHADYEYSGRYYVTYYNGDTGENIVVADSASGLDNLESYGLQIDSTTGKITSVDGQTSPTLTGNQYFSVVYYFNLPGEAEQGNVYTYAFFEDPEGAYSYQGKNYRNDVAYSTQIKQDIGKTASYSAPDVAGYAFTGSALYQFNAAGKWVPLANDAFDFSITDKTVSVTTQRGYLAFYNYYDAAGTVTVNRVYDSAYSAEPVFDGQSDYTDSSSAQVALGREYAASAASGRDGYTLVPAVTKVENSDFTSDDKGNVTVTAAEDGVTVTYYYYRQLQYTPDPGPSVYTLTVKYVNMNGGELAPSYTANKTAGSSYNLTTQTEKAITGYAIDHVDGKTEGTVRGDVTVTVYYKADETGGNQPGTDIPDEETPKTDLPESNLPETEVPDEDVPTTDLPGVTPPAEDGAVIVEPEVPLGNLPQTGTVLYVELPLVFGVGAQAISLALLGVAVSMNKKRKEENE